MARKNIPNQLTVLRLILAGVFFAVLNQYHFEFESTSEQSFTLIAAFSLFILAAVTDWLDGYLARRWQVESAFGRIMDPVCDKVLVLGAFIYLAGPRFIVPPIDGELSYEMASGVYPWMITVVLARELLVTAVRSELEAQGMKFGANIFGKLKMVLQSFAVPIILAMVWIGPIRHDWAAVIRDVVVYATVIATIMSGVPYIRGIITAAGMKDQTEDSD